MPPQNVTACSSAMPTSNMRSGNALPNLSIPVPSGIAAVMATIFGSLLRQLDQRLGEDGRVASAATACRLLHLARLDVERRDAVRPDRLVLRRHVALPLLRDHVDEERAVVVLVLLEEVDQEIEIVAVVRPEVLEAELLEERARHDHVLEELLHVAGHAVELAADERDAIHDAAAPDPWPGCSAWPLMIPFR